MQQCAVRRGTDTDVREEGARLSRADHHAAPKPDRRISAETKLLRRYAKTRDPALKEELVRRLIQVASLGLVKALDGFDLERGESFVAYAAPTILGELRRHFRDRVWEVRLPRGLQERAMAVNKAAGELGDELGRTPTVSQIAERLYLDDEEVWEALQAGEARRTMSLEVRRSKEDVESTTIMETLGQTEPGYDAVEAQLAVEEAPLDEREHRVIRLRFEENLNQYEIGRCLGVSQMQVSRIMRGALRKLLAAVRANAGDEADA
ncbi:MAG: sigma-70 family RNA polymerase sigma factor [Actinobacteria bacterium]|nr:MAG: sigma-70 family RNA polymerase sigma factor [Actinomycetota bacterium]